ncbi:hypothetical protein ACQ4PT_026738 [Festuca glaucescens]
MAAMAAIPPPAPGPSPSPSTPLPHPGPPFLASSSPPSSIPPLQSSSPKAGNGQPRARPATAPNKLGLDGGEPPPGTDGVGRVGGQEIDGGEPERGTDGSDDPRMRTDIGGGKRPQCKNSERNQRKMPTISKEKCQKVVKANEQMEKQLPEWNNYRGSNRPSSRAGQNAGWGSCTFYKLTQKTFSKLSMQLSEKSFELEIMYAEVQITKSFKTSYKQRYRKMQNSKKQLRN